MKTSVKDNKIDGSAEGVNMEGIQNIAKSKQSVVKYNKLSKESYDAIYDLYKSVNNKEDGEEVAVSEILAYAAVKLKSQDAKKLMKDIKKIQEASLTPSDRINKSYKDYLATSEKQITKDEYICMVANIH